MATAQQNQAYTFQQSPKPVASAGQSAKYRDPFQQQQQRYKVVNVNLKTKLRY